MSFVDNLPSQLKADILRISEQSDDALKVFEELYNHLLSDGNNKRKKPSSTDENGNNDDSYYQLDSIDANNIIFQLKDLSFQSPLRKKLNLTFSISPITQKPILSIGKSNDTKPELIINELNSENIFYAAFLAVPEKPQLLYLVIFYKENLNSQFSNDPIALTFNKDNLSKQLLDEKLISQPNGFKDYIQRQAQISGFKIQDTLTSANSFFVQAHRGTKEGLLYFLPDHILFGFKKPISLFHARDIESISYSSITRVTFNVTLILKGWEKHEFSMIDQSDFAQIDAYIKNRQVIDKSMSEELKAKKLTKNQDAPGALAEASQQLNEGGVPIDLVGEEYDSDDEEADANFQVGAEVDDTSDVSDTEQGSENGDDDDDDDDEDEEDEEDEDEEIDLNSDDD